MSKYTRPGQKIKLKSVEELLGVVNEESAMDIEIEKIRPFKDHPFKVLDDDKMQDLIESIRINGILSPVLIRPVGNDRYALLSRPKFRLSAEDISTAFGVSKGGMSERAKFIREELGITRNKAEWLAPELQEGAKVLAQFDRIMKEMR